jgi:hypothetical protein
VISPQVLRMTQGGIMSARTIATALLVAGLLVTANAAHAGLNDYGDPDHPLFSEQAGFAHARNGIRTPITVVHKQWLAPGLNYWNRMAGWDVLVFSDEPNPEITAVVDQHCTSCALAWSATTHQPNMYDPYERCNVSIGQDSRDARRIIAHELGHCLGLMHIHASVMNLRTARDTINPDWADGDHRLLVNAGYAD